MTVINSNRAVRGPVTAVPLVAGKGVKITADTVNNRYVAEVDETVLWEDSNGIYLNNDSAVLSETINNFESVAIYAESVYGGPLKKYEFIVISGGQYRFVTESLDGSDLLNVYFNVNITGTAVTVSRSKLLKISYSSSAITCSDLSATGTYKSKIKKVVGINRVSASA